MSFIHCKHYNGRDLFNGSTGGKCRADVDPIYSFCGGDRFGWVKKVPCLRTNETTAICPAAEYPTKEEAEQSARDFEAYVDQFVKNLSVVRPAIEQQHKETGEWSGSIECPECTKPLHWSKAKCNGHIHAACETEGCLSWME